MQRCNKPATAGLTALCAAATFTPLLNPPMEAAMQKSIALALSWVHAPGHA